MRGVAPPCPRLRGLTSTNSAPRRRCSARPSRCSGAAHPSPRLHQVDVHEQYDSAALPSETFALKRHCASVTSPPPGRRPCAERSSGAIQRGRHDAAVLHL
eukprot:15472624-Heterocapsa_arctica.AAC.1